MGLLNPLSNKLQYNTLIKHFKELKYFVNFITVTNDFKNCTNLQSLGFDNVLYNQYLATNSSNSQVIYGCTKLKRITTYNFIGTNQSSTSTGTMYFFEAHLNALLLPRASGAKGNGFAYTSGAHSMFIDFGALIKKAQQGSYTTPSTVVFRYPGIVGGNYYNYNIKIFVPSELVDDYKSDTNWSKAASRIYAIGGTEWQTLFASTSNPASEYADIEYYSPELYDEYVEGYEESKAAANAQL